MDTPTFLNDLPPLKRLSLIQQQQQHSPCSLLPAKKREETRNSTFSYNPPPPPPPHTLPSSTVYSLPAKKRVHALHPQNDAVSAFHPHPSSTAYSLPAKKRVRALHPQNDAVLPFETQPSPTVHSLPAKKRVSALHPQNDAVSPFDTQPSSTVLPAKKRVCALHPENDAVLPFETQPSPTVHSLPAKKRVRALHPENDAVSPFDIQPSSTVLPAKKRVCALHPENDAVLPFDSSPSSTIYSLPAKKRVCALKPQNHDAVSPSHTQPSSTVHSLPTQNDSVSSFDLNVEYNPSLSPTTKKQEVKIDYNDDDGIVCCVCHSTDGDPADPIVLCDGCDLMVHASCYGNPLSKGIPEGDWFCERCRFGLNNKNDDVACFLCPNKNGAMKKTTEGGWAHVVCALFVPEVFFLDPEGREGIDCSKVPKKRWLEKCYICGCCDGCAVVCSEPKCGLGFHVTCALKEDLCIEYNEGKKGATIVAGFCKTHTQLWDKQQLSGKYKIVAVDDK